MNLGFISLGCPKNLVDTEVMLGLVEKKGLTIVDEPEEADILVVNTCGFIEAAKQESIEYILKLAEFKKTGACKHLIVTGCLAQRYARELFDEMTEIDAIIGVHVFREIGDVIDRLLEGERVFHFTATEFRTAKTPKEKIAKAVEAFSDQPRKLTTPEHYSYLRIAEGCDNFCSYCAIPMIRGSYISKPYEQVMKEAEELVAAGTKEIILVAQDTTRYGEDLYGELMLPRLLRDLNALEGLKWIRVLYCYPNNFNDELIEAFATLPKVCKYVDLPLQHASNRLLKSMNRHDRMEDTEKLLNKLRERIPEIVIRTTFIVGFPGETEEDISILHDFVARQKFENAGVFQYSQEEGTVAGRMPNQIAEEIKEIRYDDIMSLQAGISEEMHHNLEGVEMEVVIEDFEDDGVTAVGRSYRQAPDIDGDIYIENAGDYDIGDFVKVRIEQGFAYETVATII